MTIFDDIFSGEGSVTDLLLSPAIAGIPCKFAISQSDRTYNSSTGEWSKASVESDAVICSVPLEYDIREIDGTEIRQGDFKIYVSSTQWVGLDTELGTMPAKGQSVTLLTDQHKDGSDYRPYTIVNVKPQSTGIANPPWEVQCRNG